MTSRTSCALKANMSDTCIPSGSQTRRRAPLGTSKATPLRGAIRIGGDNKVESFLEKPIGDGGAINGGFFVLEPPIFEYIEGETTYWEKEPLETLARDGQLMAYRHTGFWHAMDTMRDRKLLDELWGSGHAPWKIWE